MNINANEVAVALRKAHQEAHTTKSFVHYDGGCVWSVLVLSPGRAATHKFFREPTTVDLMTIGCGQKVNLVRSE